MAEQKFSQNLRTRIAMVQETVWGDTPANPAMTLLPVTAFSLNLTRNELKDTSIRADRQARYSISGNSTVAGDIGVDLAPTFALTLLASAMKGVTDVNGETKVGVTQTSFTCEQGSLDTNLYSVYTGLVVDSAQISIGLNDVLKATFSVIGQDMAVAEVPMTGATYSDEPVEDPYTHFSGTIKENGVACGYLTQMEINLASGSVANYALGDTFAKNITFGMSDITLSTTAYFKDHVLLNKFLNGNSTSFEITAMNANGDKITFTVPKVKLTQATKQISTSGSITLSISASALFDTVTSTSLSVKTA